MNKKITLLFLLLFVRIVCNGQEMNFKKNIKILNDDYDTCYTIGNYMLCPERKMIRVGRMFGTATKDYFGYFPDSTLNYDQDTMIIFGGIVFFNKSNLNIDWKSVPLLSYGSHYVQFTNGEFLFHIENGTGMVQ